MSCTFVQMLKQRGAPSPASARSAPSLHLHHHPASTPCFSSVRAATHRKNHLGAAAAADPGTGTGGATCSDCPHGPDGPLGLAPRPSPRKALPCSQTDPDSLRQILKSSGQPRDHRRHHRRGPVRSRRDALLRLAGSVAAASAAAACLSGGGLVVAPGPAAALPLGPLGPVKRVGGEKLTGLTAEQVAEILRRDLAEGQYFVTGDLTREVFADDCRFVDPTNDVTGLSKYLTALGVLFDPLYSKVELLDIRPTGRRTVEADWRLGGYLVFPWNPRVEPFQGHTVYTLNEQGLVSEQRQTWSISAATALIESFTPTWGARRQLF